MAALQNLLPVPELEQLSVSFDALRTLVSAKNSVPTKDASRVIYKCNVTGVSKMIIASKLVYYMLSILALHF